MRKANLPSERRKRLSQMPYDYAAYLENNSHGDLVHVRMLPHSKEDLISSFLCCIANAKNNVEIELLKAGLETLTGFQNIGEHDRIKSPDLSNFDTKTVEGMIALGRAMQPVVKLRQQIWPLVESDHLRFQRLTKRAVAANEHMWPFYKKWLAKLNSLGARQIPAEWVDYRY